MRITIIAIGSRGDIQPYMALSRGLSRAGHVVRLVTHAAFALLVRSHNIEFFPLDDEPEEFFQTRRGKASLRGNPNAFLYVYRLKRMLDPLIEGYMKRCLQACEDADVIIVTYMSFLEEAACGDLFAAITLADESFSGAYSYLVAATTSIFWRDAQLSKSSRGGNNVLEIIYACGQ